MTRPVPQLNFIKFNYVCFDTKIRGITPIVDRIIKKPATVTYGISTIRRLGGSYLLDGPEKGGFDFCDQLAFGIYSHDYFVFTALKFFLWYFYKYGPF